MFNKRLTQDSYFTKDQYDNMVLLENCVSDVEFLLEERPEIVVYNRICRQNRDIGFFSNDSKGYKYSKKLMPSKPLTENLKTLLTDINKRFDSNFNGILVNRYRDGTRTIGKHSDDESGLGKNGGVVSLSYGATRKFRIRNKPGVAETNIDILLDHGTLLYMGGHFQRQFTHEIPKETKVGNERISFTFREHRD